MLIPAYRPLLKLAKPVQKQIHGMARHATSALQDCFQDTDWNMFKEAATYNNHTDLQEYTETVTVLHQILHWWCDSHQDHHHTCKPEAMDDSRGFVAAKTQRWSVQIQEIKRPSKQQEPICSRGIKNAKRLYGNKINNQFTNSRDTRSLWQGIQTITDYKPPPQACDDDTSLPDALNHFYSRFEMQNTHLHKNCPHLPATRHSVCLQPT